jgi:hypothetical protein
MNESTELKGPILCEHCGSPIDATTPVRVNAGTAGTPWNLLPGWFHQQCGGAARAAYLAAEDDLGDTPEHLRPLLRAAREIDPKALVYDDGTLAPGVIPSKGRWFYASKRDDEWTADYIARRMAADDGMILGFLGREAIAAGRVYPTADARRIGREEFGMVFDGDPGTLRDMVAKMPPLKGRVSEVIVAESCPPCACGATTNLRAVVIERSASVTVYANRCGACEQERRRTELLAEMDRKLPPKKLEKSLAPASWPEDAGDDYEL